MSAVYNVQLGLQVAKRLYHGKSDVLNSSSTVLPFPQEKLAKSVNMRAMNMLGQAEERVRASGYCVSCRDQRGRVWISGMSVGSMCVCSHYSGPSV